MPLDSTDYSALQSGLNNTTTPANKVLNQITVDTPYGQVIQTCTDVYLDCLDLNNLPSPATIEAELLSRVKDAIEGRNLAADKKDQWSYPKALTPTQIAAIMAKLYKVCRISTSDDAASIAGDFLAIYQTDGPNEGIYVSNEDAFKSLASQFDYNITIRGVDEVMAALNRLVPRKVINHDPDLIAVNNGIFDYQKKELMPFTPDIVFTSKSHVNYNPNAKNEIIHNDEDGTDWDVESWMEEISDTPDIAKLLWQISGAIIRPMVRWDKAPFLYSEEGANGKGTYCQLLRNICGPGSYASVKIEDFSNDAMLEPLLQASAIITDENDVGIYLDSAANMKAVITNDFISINRKYKTAITFQFFGLMVQCLNEMPKIRDRSNSL